MKVILVPVADRPECRIALRQAFRLADAHGANVMGCHLRLHRADAPEGRRPRYRLLVWAKEDDAASKASRRLETASRAAHRLFTESAGVHGFELIKRPRLGAQRTAHWFEMVGALDKLFSIAGPVADMSVVSRPGRSASGHGANFLLSAVLHSGRPVLVLPPAPAKALGRRILIAWNQSPEVARAVSAAMPMLRMAEAVHIFNAGQENIVGPKAVKLAHYLRYWGVKSTRSSNRGRDEQGEIEACYRETNSDLIVMGAYSRSRMREIIFGGMTQHMLYHSRHPVFTLHS